MSFESYTIFDAVVKEKSFFRASERLNLSPSTISHSVTTLEERFNVKLFNRSKKGITLTSIGEYLMPYIENVLKTENILKQQAKLIQGEETGIVRIGLFNSVCISWLPIIIKKFRENHPKIEVVIYEGGYQDILGWINSKSVDIAFVSTTVYFDDIKILYQDRLVCVAPNDFKPLNENYVTIDDIKNNDIILQLGSNNAEVERFFSQNGITSKSSFVINSDQSFISLVECGFGLCILQELNMLGSHANVNVFPIKPETYRTIGLVLSDSEYATPPVLCMYNHIIDVLNELHGSSLD